MGDIQATSDKVFEMYRRYAVGDRYPWGVVGMGCEGVEVDGGVGSVKKGCNLTDSIELVNGSKWWKETAGSKNAGRSGTVQVLHMDEVAFFTNDSGKDPTTAVLGSFYQDGPMSLGFATSTPNGASGWFYNTWRSRGNGWEKVFAAWYEFEDSVREFSCAEEREEFGASLTDDERAERELYGVSLEQLNWRRHTIETLYEGDVDKFRQEFPSNDRDCFLLSSRPRFSVISLRNLRVETEKQDKEGVRGVLLRQGEREVTFRVDSGAGSLGLRLWEEPKIGCRYVLGVDTCRGRDQQMGHGTSANPDFHSAQVWRAEYMDPVTRRYFRPKLVCHHHSQVEADVLAEIVELMSLYYGGCLVVPELNDGAGYYLVKVLHAAGVHLYRRDRSVRRIGARTPTEQERLKPYGWNTDKATKRWVIDALVPLVRDEAIEFSDLRVQHEFETFVVNKHGQAEASPGEHDDCVMAAALALYNIGAGTEYRPRYLRSTDLRRLARDPSYLAPGGFVRG